MTATFADRCSALAEALQEPMAGTADHRERWLLVEDRGAWGDHAVRDVLGSELEAAAKERRMRLLLIRRREAADAGGERQAFLVDPAAGRVARRALGDPTALHALLDVPLEGFGEVTEEPMFLVCTNGRRDACCALRGRVLVTALAARHGSRTWECTHLGGHRFAGNLVCLPDGFMYGRVTGDDGGRLADAYLDRRIDVSLLRGRSTWPAPAQVAEIDLRQRLGLDGVDDVRLRSVERREEEATVELDAAGAGHRFELVAERHEPPRPTGCRGDKLETPTHWRVVRTTSEGAAVAHAADY
jgi:hypothetical protein